ncbi:MAG: hypothetical protein US11_C0004G0078 [Candidatus Roizmanbacteria bacterium GW2011_GWA2_36_23]|uniref:TRAM domain-containing protein n=1 Tax=Candidatus Roizmanbacteria bacterium GW2011_GWA2_36_23 TaxID=1618480 RepID=A0A0G0E4J1_9BACT|nr:MAG: hypothetical protein US11_C0004G0078 [Candidatus Roizmanbacteria bacterium GW2011_GWA2_36_23]
MKKLIAIADWSMDSLSCQEYKSVVEGYLKDTSNINISFVNSTPSTIHTSFLLYQITLIEERYGRPQNSVIIQNTDSRTSLNGKEIIINPQGGKFLVIRLKSGIIICGPNAGLNFSMIKNNIDEVFVYQDIDKNSQFRSRDAFARVCSHLLEGLQDELELEEISKNAIPTLSGYFIGHIDNFGNIKTTILQSELKGKFEYGDFVKVKINNITKKVKYVKNLFGNSFGELIIYPGSSGRPEDPFLEVTIWRNFENMDNSTGWQEFKQPSPGMSIYFS